MKNVFLVLLCCALGVCLIWGCSLNGERDGILKDKAQLARRYEILQVLYSQTRQELTQAQEDAQAKETSYEDQLAQMNGALARVQDALDLKPEETAETAVSTDEPLPESTDAPAIFPVPQPETGEPALPETPAEPDKQEEQAEDLSVADPSADTEKTDSTEAQPEKTEPEEDEPEEIILPTDEEIPLG